MINGINKIDESNDKSNLIGTDGDGKAVITLQQDLKGEKVPRKVKVEILRQG